MEKFILIDEHNGGYTRYIYLIVQFQAILHLTDLISEDYTTRDLENTIVIAVSM